MGVRKLLKTSLALLVVGGVSFAGAAVAGPNIIDVDQQNADQRIESGPANGKPLQVGSGNEVHVTQSAEKKVEIYIKQAKGDTADPANAVENNKVGTDTDRLIMEVDSSNTNGTIEFHIEQGSNNNEIVVVNPNDTSVDKKIHATNGNITITIKQGTDNNHTDGNKVYFGHLFTNNSLTMSITQDGADEANFQNLDAGSVDLTIEQKGASTIEFTDVESLDSTANYGVEVGGAVTGGIKQDAGSTFKADALHVGGNLVLHDKDGSSALDQENGHIKLLQSDISGNLTLNVTQDNSGKNTLALERVKVNGNAEITLNQSGSDESEVLFGNGTTIYPALTAGSIEAKVNQAENGTSSIEKKSTIAIVGGEVDGILKLKGYAGDTFETTGSNNDYVINTLNTGGDATLANYMEGKDNSIQVATVDVKNDLDLKTNIVGNGNKVKVKEEYSSQAGADVDINIQASNVIVQGMNDDGTIDSTGLVQHDDAASSTGTLGNFIDMDVSVDSAGVYLYQRANGAMDMGGGNKYSNYADINVAGAASFTLKLYQDYNGGTDVANKAVVDVNDPSATYDIGAVQIQTGSGANIYLY